MVAVVSGNGLGLFNTSFTQLGTGLWGQAGIGQSRESQYVNIATGNLILQDWDELISVRGFDATALRTYNSQGTVSGIGQDGFITGYERSLVLSGSLNNVNSTVTLQTGDGQSVVFKYSGTSNQYVSTDGDGANDTLVWSGGTNGTWTYTEGTTRREELYSTRTGGTQLSTVTAYLTRIRDLTSDGTTPAQYTVSYDGSNRVWKVLSNDGSGTPDGFIYTYDGSGRLSTISTQEGGATKGQVTYSYDTYGRLAWAEHQLTANLSTSGAAYDSGTATAFRATYTYVTASASDLRIASVTTSDGATVAYTYDASNRIATVKQGSASDGSLQTVTFTYNANSTDVTDAAGRTWTYQYDANKQLTAVLEPAISGQRTTTTYAYTSAGDSGGAGNVKSIEVQRAGTVLSRSDFSYDASGNLLWQWQRTSGGSNTATAVQKTYNSANQVLTETVYTGLDSDGPGASAPTGGLTTNFIYDAQNRVRFVVDATGAVREWNYSTSSYSIGQAYAERLYTGASYSGAYTLSALTSWATTTQKASSQLTEYRYDVKGRVSSVTDYATVDASGNGTLDAYTDITWFTYDAHNQLLQKILVHGAGRAVANTGTAAPVTSEVTDYVYDGMGRLLTVLQRDAATAQTGSGATWDGATLLTQYAYLDTANQLRVTLDSGAVRTETRNKAGLLTSASEVGTVSGATVNRTSLNYYDATGRLRASEDAAGGRTYFFYDATGRLTAQVDAVGAVIAYAYDGLGRIQQTTQYATKVDTSGWLSSGAVTKDTLVFAASNPSPTASQAWVPTSAANDRTTTCTYDALGRLLTETTATTAAAAQVTTYAYDGASRLLSTTANAVGGLAADARVTRYFYDNAGRQVGVLDAAGYLKETVYDAGGRRIKTVAYATLTNSSYWASGTLTQLRPTAANSDAATRYFYDARGQVVAELAYASGTAASGNGYLTEYVYDEQGNQRAVKQYARQLTSLDGNETLATLRAEATSASGAPAELYRLTQRSFNGLGQLAVELSAVFVTDSQTTAERISTHFSYDDSGRLIKTAFGYGTSELRENNRRYDVFGNLIGELGGEGSEHLLSGMDESELNAVYATYGTTHSYDLLGRRIESTDALGTGGAGGNKTWYFYDAQGRLTFTVRGIESGGVKNALGEVAETRYSAFGQVTDTLAYTGRITIAGTQTRANVQTALNVLTFVAASDTRRQFTYDRRGLLTSSMDAEGVVNNYNYTAFGQLLQEQRAVSTSAAMTIQHAYDKRGLETSRIDAYGVVGLARSTSQVFDAFGRITSTTDGNGAVRTFVYDRLGRQVSHSQVVEGRTDTWSSAYDAFSRMVSQTDALGKVTDLAYNDASRTLTVTSPEAVVTVTTYGRHGQTVSVKDGTNQTTTYTYNDDGQLLTVTDPLGNVLVDNVYNERGLLLRTFNATGDVVDFRYDAVGRVLRRIEDAGTGKLNLTTTYTYDGQGRRVSVSDPTGVATSFTFDREGRLTQQAIDPAGLNLRTSYTWDAAGRQLTVVEGVGAVSTTTITTAYTYDALGRRITEVRGSGSLNLTTTYVYDANDNVIARQDAAGNWTRYGYDEAGRLRFTLSPAGNLEQTSYDANGRVYKTRRYANLVNMSGVGTSLTLAQLKTLATSTGTQATDLVEYRVYNNDGQMRYRIDGAGNAVAFAYDAAGRNTIEKQYVLPISAANLPAALASLEAGTATIASLGAVVPATAGQDQMITRVFDAAGRMIKQTDALGSITRFIYDNAGRTVATIDATGAVTRRWFDAAGREIASRQFATAWTGATDSTTMTLLDQAMANSWTAADRQTYTLLDRASRVRFTIDATNGWTEYTYDGAGRRVSSREHADPVAIDTALQAKLWAGTATYSMPTTVNNAADRTSYWVYNETNQVKYIIDAAGYAKSFAYDAAGRQVISRDYFGALNFSQAINGSSVRDCLGAGTLSVNDMGTYVVPSAPGHRTTYQSLDGVGRVRYLMTAIEGGQATVSEWRYDAAGHLTEQLQYAKTIGFAFWLTPAQVAALVTTAGGDQPVNQRLTRMAYDGTGRLRFTVDDAGAVSEHRYDAAGNLSGEYRYGGAVSGVSQYTQASLAGWVDGRTAALNTTYQYNAVGQVTRTTDNLGNFEQYGYDAAGNRTSYTNKLSFTWNYLYDGMGQLTKELTPTVSVLRYDSTGATVSEEVRIATSYTYDAFGNVATKTENADAGVLDRRTVQYVYDSRGLQIRTIFPDAYTLDTSLNIVAVGVQPETTVAYDALGRAVVQRDVLGNYSYKTYDSRGLLAYEVDPSGYVTAYSYNAYGEQTGLTRYATSVNVAGRGWTPLTVSDMEAVGFLTPAPTQDRQLTFLYDQRGNKVEVQQSTLIWTRADGSTASAAPRTAYQFDAIGNLVKESTLIDAGDASHAEVWAETYHYYDEVGQRIRSVDAEGYVTAWTYNLLGQASAITEYARAISTVGLSTAVLPGLPDPGSEATGYDRTTSFTYDSLGRKATEVSWRHLAAGSTSAASVTTTTGYDAAGQVTSISVNSALGTTATTTSYDKIGRVTTVAEQARQVLVSNWQALLEANPTYRLDPSLTPQLYVMAQPIAAMAYDAFGNVVWSNRFANGLQSGVPLATGPSDQSTLTRYDHQGRVLYSTDAAGKTTYYRYDAADHIIEQFYWRADGNGSNTYIRSTYTYDASGRQITMNLFRTPSGGTEVLESSEAAAYNAFGEVSSKAWQTSALNNAATAAMYEYDTAGRIVRSNAESGTYRRYSYNLAGVQVREERDWTDGATSRTAVYSQSVDRLGRVTALTAPSYTSVWTLSATTSAQLDRWGNVLAQTDALGAVTEWIYNEANQALRQLAPMVNVVSEAGVSASSRPSTYWTYDVLGNLLQEKDANLHIRTFTYDATSRLTSRIDGANAKSFFAYDALGQQLATENALHYVTYLDYDKGGRAVEQGDFRLNLAGTARVATAMQSFVLDQDGNRLSVADARNGTVEGGITVNTTHKYVYDARGNLLQSLTPTGVQTNYGYDRNGRKTSEGTAVGSQSWVYDYFGRVTAHSDLSGASVSYVYDSLSGQLKQETLGGATRVIAYNADGRVRSITEGSKVYTYEYDANGNRTLEKTVTTDGGGQAITVETRSYYDALNRLQRVTSDDTTASSFRMLDVTYAYDAVGNRRKVTADTSYGPGATPVGGSGGTPNHQELWFTYDGENRVLVANGTLANGVIDIVGKDSWAYAYNAAGYATSRTIDDAGTKKIGAIQVDDRGQVTKEYFEIAQGENSNGIRKAYVYDLAGHVTVETEYFALDDTETGTYAINIGQPDFGHDSATFGVGGWTKHRDSYVYDSAGRVLSSSSFGRTQRWRGEIAAQFENDSNPDLSGYVDDVYLMAQATYTAFDAGGRLITHQVWHAAYGLQAAFTSTFTHSYIGKEMWLESGVAATTNVTNYRDSETASTYDAWGRRLTLTETTPLSDYKTTLIYKRYFATDAEGGILSRRDGEMKNNVFTQTGNGYAGESNNPAPNFITSAQWSAKTEAERKSLQGLGMNQRFVYSNGQQVAILNKAGKLKVGELLTGFESSDLGAGEVLVTVGDTLASIAQRVYGNSSLWFILADANAVSDDTIFAGQILKTPKVTTSKNDAATFKPYNPAEVVGPTEPNTPYIKPPPPQSCKAMAVILSVAVIVIASLINPVLGRAVEGAIGTGILATGLSAAASTAIASTVTSAVGSSLGVSSFSWRSIASNAVSAGLTAGLGAYLGKPGKFSNLKTPGTNNLNPLGRMVQGIGNYASGVVANAAAGRDAHFSWKAVAATAVGAYLGAKLPIDKLKIVNSNSDWGQVANGWIQGLAYGGLAAGVRQAVGLGEPNWRQISIDAFGNALGNAAVRRARTASTLSSLTPEQRGSYEGMVRDGIPRADALKYAQQTAGALPAYLYRQPLDAEQSAARLEELQNIQAALAASGRDSVTTQTADGAVATGVRGSFVYDPNLWDMGPKGYPVPKSVSVIDSMQYDSGLAIAGYEALYSNSLRFAIGRAERGSAMPFDFPGLDASPQALFDYNKDAQWWLYERSKQPQVGNEGATFALMAAVGGAYSFLKAIPEAVGGVYDISSQPARDMQDMLTYLKTSGQHGVSPETVNQRRLQTLVGLHRAVNDPVTNVLKPWYSTTIAAYDRGDGFEYGMRVTDASIGVVATIYGGGVGNAGKAGMVSRELRALNAVPNSSPLSQAAIRARVEANVAQSAAARASSNFEIHALNERVPFLDSSTPADRAIVWSNARGGNLTLADDFIAQNPGYIRLEETPGGQYLLRRNLFERYEYEQAIQPWERLSARYATGASGQVTAFTSGASPTSVFQRIELPILLRNPNVTNIKYMPLPVRTQP